MMDQAKEDALASAVVNSYGEFEIASYHDLEQVIIEKLEKL
jgi:hypothetical protein